MIPLPARGIRNTASVRRDAHWFSQPDVELFFVLLILLVVTRTFGEVAERFGQHGLVGELAAGIVLGTLAAQQTDLLPEIANLSDNRVFDALTDLGMFFIMLLAGVGLGLASARTKGEGGTAISRERLPWRNIISSAPSPDPGSSAP